MKEDLLRDWAERHLLPFFSGAEVASDAVPSNRSGRTVAFINPQTIGFKVNKEDKYRLQFRRDQPFARKKDPALETRVIEAFVDVLREMNEGLNGELQSVLATDLSSTFQRRVVAHAIAEKGQDRKLLEVIDQIDQMALWATRSYEGLPIASAIGITAEETGIEDLSLEAIAKNDFGTVLSNGFDTMLVFDKNLNFVRHSALPPSEDAKSIHTPLRHLSIANWTTTSPETWRVAVVLNRTGEILVFRDQQLLFARRSGAWHFLTHAPVLGQMVVPSKRYEIREALYETAIDASFARTGACLGVVSSASSRNAWKETISESDRLRSAKSKKSLALAKVVDGRKFHELPRILRQELVAIDGATVIDHEGEILAVGAILRIDGGSTGGGRTAAAETLARFGLGIKVSQDGGITAYRPILKEPGKMRAAFRVM